MIPSIIFEFLKELMVNNNKEWFQNNKSMYQQAKKEFEIYVNELIAVVHAIDPKVGYPNAKDCIFRIFRDVRFSKDKTPYKNNFGVYIAHGGRKSPYGGYYLHIEPDNSFIGGGVYSPQPNVLKVIREIIIECSDEYKMITEDSSFKNEFPEIWGDKLKMAPKGFPKDDPNIELIKLKSYALVTQIDDNQMESKNIENKISKIFKIIKPYNDFLNTAIKESLSQ